jgi:hypothetical protein
MHSMTSLDAAMYTLRKVWWNQVHVKRKIQADTKDGFEGGFSFNIKKTINPTHKSTATVTSGE